MTYDRYRMGFHLMPPTGWINDPNGCCQRDGIYHVWHQYSPHWPHDTREDRGWGHAWSRDLVLWHHDGWLIHPGDIPEDATGTWSGSALDVDGVLTFYLTGNVREVGDYDFIRNGRQQNQIYIECTDAFTPGQKHVFLRNSDYPGYCSCHVRDPYVWKQPDPAGNYHLVLGARDLNDEGFALIYDSRDGHDWHFRHDVRSARHFGYMWECPNRIALSTPQAEIREFLDICPMGLQASPMTLQNRDLAGYIPLDGPLLDATVIDETRFTEWDLGFDFYAPQVLIDDGGRVLLFGWMGTFDTAYRGAIPGMSWCGCLSVPRELTLQANGLISQYPAHEIEALRLQEVPLTDGSLTAPDYRVDVAICGIEGNFELCFDQALVFSLTDGTARLAFTDETAAEGRSERRRLVGNIDNMRVLVDNSAVEIYLNGGSLVFSTRWFPTKSALKLRFNGHAAHIHAWTMGDGMSDTYRA